MAFPVDYPSLMKESISCVQGAIQQAKRPQTRKRRRTSFHAGNCSTKNILGHLDPDTTPFSPQTKESSRFLPPDSPFKTPFRPPLPLGVVSNDQEKANGKAEQQEAEDAASDVERSHDLSSSPFSMPPDVVKVNAKHDCHVSCRMYVNDHSCLETLQVVESVT